MAPRLLNEINSSRTFPRVTGHGKGVCVFLLSLLSIFGTACSDAPEDVPQERHRVVSLAPVIADLVVALDAVDRLVGRTRWARTFVPEVRSVPSVGDGLQPNVEAIAGRRPDLVLMYETPANGSAIAQLERFGVTVREFPLDQLSELPPAAREIGRLLGKTAAGDSVATAIEAWLARPEPPVQWRVAFIVEDQPVITLGGGSFLTGIARRAGAENVFADQSSPSPIVSLEAILERDPDAILLFGDSADAGFLGRPEWQSVPAVHARRVIYINGPGFGYPSVHAPEAVIRLRRDLESLP